MTTAGHPLLICFLVSVFCFSTPFFIFMLLVFYKNWYGMKCLEKLTITIWGCIPIAVYFSTAIMFNTACKELINEIPINIQLIIVYLLAAIDFIVSLVGTVLMADFPRLEGGGGYEPNKS